MGEWFGGVSAGGVRPRRSERDSARRRAGAGKKLQPHIKRTARNPSKMEADADFDRQIASLADAVWERKAHSARLVSGKLLSSANRDRGAKLREALARKPSLCAFLTVALSETAVLDEETIRQLRNLAGLQEHRRSKK